MARPKKEVEIVAKAVEPVEQSADLAADAPIDEPVNQVEALQAELARIEEEKNAVLRREAELTAQLDEVLEATDTSYNPQENQLAIMAALEASKREREARVSRRNELLNLGVSPHELADVVRAPVDQFLASQVKNRYPHRPVYSK
jgi:aspartate aminotransferase-like enzyme